MASYPNPTQPALFTDELRAASRKQHARNTAVVASKLIVVLTHRQQYGRALCCFWHVHAALEAHLSAACASVPELALLAPVLPDLQRPAAFEQDIRYFLGKDWQEKASPAVMVYLTRLEVLARDDPVLLLAHAWAQYAALLAGGQIIQKMVRRALRLGKGPGTAAFSFKERPDIIRQRLKHAVNSAPLSEQQRQRVLTEHCLVFKLNSDIVKDFKIQWRSIFAMHRRALVASTLLFVVIAYVILGRLRR